MAYKTLLTVLADADLSLSVLDQAATLAAETDAHLDALALGVDETVPNFYYAGATAMIEQRALEAARDQAQAAETAAAEALEGRALRWSANRAVVQLGSLHNLVGGAARYADLVVLPQPYAAAQRAVMESVVEATLFSGQAPVLVLPEGMAMSPQPRRIILAWNDSTEALAAVRAALPLLQSADVCEIVIVDPPQHSPDRSDPGGALSQMLARHGVRPKVSVIAATVPSTADVICRHATDKSADLIVMGAYGHSRFREAILGGATRHMLERAVLPVFMKH